MSSQFIWTGFQVAALKISRRERIMDALRSNPKVRMRDPAVVEQKLKLLVEGGLDKLMVSIWWRSAHQHIVNAKFTYQAIERFVEASKIELRDEADEMILDLSENDVPLIIFSAGIGNVIDIYLKKRLGKKPRNVHLISNMMDFDELGVVNGFREPLIHTFCKNGSVIGRKRSFYSDVALRTNVLLMGDSLGDLNMDVGVEGETVALKIGFLNFNVDSLLENFLNGYDIVLIDDQSMNVARNIIEMVSQTKHIHTNSHTYAIADHTAVADRLEWGGNDAFYRDEESTRILYIFKEEL
ncbi:unnamed protein product [Anisakis simplex]|uniref:5'-nucleotidase n=1 Tax=Anisakis simplex TaxID=6269 RepID=A0A0M3K6T5_ANISI|nr:unnamed protein product [Anisakis simplex]